jgi:succinate dehydrogenase / fumarate reductase membrane anchor subunit
MKLRTPLSNVRGLGSAKDGTNHWWMQRLTAIALVPLSIWFVVAVLCIAGADYSAARAWVASPVNSTLLIALIIALFYHAQLGVQVVVEDYIHTEWFKLSSLILLRFATAILAIASVLSVLRITFGAA